MQRDNSSREDASARLNSQLSITEKVQYADVVIDNSGSHKDLDSQIDTLVKKLDQEMGWMWLIGFIIPPLSILSALWVLAVRSFRRSWAKKRGKKRD